VLIGQGTGPFALNQLELDSLDAAFDRSIPLTTTLEHFGHTLGASSLLSVALAALGIRSNHPLKALSMKHRFACDGRPLLNGEVIGPSAIVSCKALNGTIAVAGLNVGMNPLLNENEWKQECAVTPLMHETLRKIEGQARSHRPSSRPHVLLVLLDAPLIPPPRARVGNGMLPTAVLEITPGCIPQLISRCWGFDGPAFCLVGDDLTRASTSNVIASLQQDENSVSCVHISGKGMNRELNWEFNKY
jgi:hypothetical protein